MKSISIEINVFYRDIMAAFQLQPVNYDTIEIIVLHRCQQSCPEEKTKCLVP